MGKQRVVYVWREHLLGSAAYRSLAGRQQGDYLKTLTLLTVTEESNPLRGCLVVGREPMSFDQWRAEMDYRRKSDAAQSWERLHAVGLFETAEILGRTYTRVARFGANQDRMKNRGNRENNARERTRNEQRSAHTCSQKSVELEQYSDHPILENKELTKENSGTPQDRSIDRSGSRSDRRSRSGSTGSPTGGGGISSVGEIAAGFGHGPASVWELEPYELAEAAARLESHVEADRALRLWRERVERLRHTPGGLDRLRELLEEVAKSGDPNRGTGEFRNPAAYVNAQTKNYLNN